jgi:hypothetical protein
LKARELPSIFNIHFDNVPAAVLVEHGLDDVGAAANPAILDEFLPRPTGWIDENVVSGATAFTDESLFHVEN